MNVLLIEDDPAQASGLTKVLGACPVTPKHAVTHVGTLAEGEARLRAETYDCVLLDLGLPDGSGLESYRRVEAAAPRTPVVVVTGASEEEVGADLIKAGAQEFLQKGQFDAWLVCRAVTYAVLRHERQRLGAELATAAERLDDALGLADADRRVEAAKGIVKQLRELAALAFPGSPVPVQVEAQPGGGAVVTVPPGATVEVKRKAE